MVDPIPIVDPIPPKPRAIWDSLHRRYIESFPLLEKGIKHGAYPSSWSWLSTWWTLKDRDTYSVHPLHILLLALTDSRTRLHADDVEQTAPLLKSASDIYIFNVIANIPRVTRMILRPYW